MPIFVMQNRFKWQFLFYSLLVILIMAFYKDMLRHLVYFPDTKVLEQERSVLKSQGFQTFEKAGMGSEFRGYIRPVSKPKKIIMIFHGNAGHAAHRTYISQGFLSMDAVIVLAEYPGYGERKGSPNERSLYEAALEDVKKIKEKYRNLPLVIIGESLGTGVACWLAEHEKISGLILISPFTSLVDVGKYHYWFLPVDFLAPDRYESKTILKRISSKKNNQKKERQFPLLVFHGTEDDVVPFKFGKGLVAAYDGPKVFFPLEEYGHNNIPWLDFKGDMWMLLYRWFQEV